MKIVVTYPCPVEGGCGGTIDVPVNDGLATGSTRETMQEAANRVQRMDCEWVCNRCGYRGGLTGNNFAADVDAELDALGFEKRRSSN